MKKTVLLLAVLLSSLGSFAEVVLPKVSTDAEKHYYVIKNLRCGKYAYYDGDNVQLKQKEVPTSNETVNNYLWYFTADGDAYKMHNVGTEKYYNSNNSFTPNGATVYVKENPFRRGYVCISTTANLTSNCWDDQGMHTTIGNYNPRNNDNEGTSWVLEEVSSTQFSYSLSDNVGNVFTGTYDCCEFNGYKSLPRTKTIALENVEWTSNSISAKISFPFAVSSSTIVNPTLIANGASWSESNSRKWRVVEESGTNYVKFHKTAVTTADLDALWAIYPQLADGCFKYTIKNVKTGTYVNASATAIGDGSDVLGNTKPVTLNEVGTVFAYELRTGENWNFVYVNQSGDDLKLSINGTADNNKYLGVYSGGHSGNDVAFPDFATEMSGFPISVSSWNKTNALMISSFKDGYANGFQHAYKWYVTNNSIKIHRGSTATISTLADFAWAIYPMPVGSEMRYAIKHIASGRYIHALATFTQKGDHSGDEVELSNAAMYYSYDATNGSFYYYPSGSTLKHYLSCNSSGDANQFLGVWTSNHPGSKNDLLALSYTFNVSNVGYATLYSPFAGTITGPANVKTYAITIDDVLAGNGYVTMNERTGVPAEQGAIVEAPEGTYTFTAANVDSDWSLNLLMGTYVDTYVDGAAYVLSNGDNGVGLYLAEMNKNAEGAAGTTHFLNNAGKAFLPASALPSAVMPVESRFLAFGFDTETGIEETENGNVKTENSVIYDLSGRRVQNAQKGIYVVNGKVVIK